VPKSKRQNRRLTVFKGREAKLNKAIFQILALKCPQTIYDMHKAVKALKGLRYIRYASVNKRMKALEETGYLRKIGVKETKAGFKAKIYELTARAYLAIAMNSMDLEELVAQLDDTMALTMLTAMISLFSEN
jgi:DNA-binding Lrp family transcriptional regulator